MTENNQTLSISTFCEIYGISHSMFYRLQRQNKGPRIMKVGRRTLITAEAAQEWQQQMEQLETTFQVLDNQQNILKIRKDNALRYISNQREYRLIKQLLRGPTSRKNLNDIVGALNIPEHIRRLRSEARGWIFHCNRIHMKDRDGKKCKPGIYSLAPSEMEDAIKAINNWEKKKGVAAPSSKSDSNNPTSENTVK